MFELCNFAFATLSCGMKVLTLGCWHPEMKELMFIADEGLKPALELIGGRHPSFEAVLLAFR